jgi:hypothetical protein
MVYFVCPDVIDFCNREATDIKKFQPPLIELVQFAYR